MLVHRCQGFFALTTFGTFLAGPVKSSIGFSFFCCSCIWLPFCLSAGISAQMSVLAAGYLPVWLLVYLSGGLLDRLSVHLAASGSGSGRISICLAICLLIQLQLVASGSFSIHLQDPSSAGRGGSSAKSSRPWTIQVIQSICHLGRL